MDLKPIKIKENEDGGIIDFKAMMRDSYVDLNIQDPYIPPAISIGEHVYKGLVRPLEFGGYGDYSVITGESKSRKSYLLTAIEACYLGGKSSNYFTNIKGHNADQKVLVAVDTEQSRKHAKRRFKRVKDMVGGDCDRYVTYGLRRYSPKERWQFIEYLIYESEYKNDIGLLSIDGYVDLGTDFNNLEESNEISNKILKWTEDKQIHITGVLHTNPKTEKPTGHLGSIVLKKAEGIMFIKNEGEYSHVRNLATRNKPWQPFNIAVDQNTWLPYEMEGITNTNDKFNTNFFN